MLWEPLGHSSRYAAAAAAVAAAAVSVCDSSMHVLLRLSPGSFIAAVFLLRICLLLFCCCSAAAAAAAGVGVYVYTGAAYAAAAVAGVAASQGNLTAAISEAYGWDALFGVLCVFALLGGLLLLPAALEEIKNKPSP